MSSILVKALLFSLAVAVHGYQGGYEYEVDVIFVNITSFDDRYFEINDNVITWKQSISDDSSIKVLYFFAREKDHKRFDQIDSRIDFCFWLSGIDSRLRRPIYNFQLDDALGITKEICPITPAKRLMNMDFFPHAILTDRYIPCDTQNFFFDIFHADEYSPLLTVWVQFFPRQNSPACD